MNFLVACQQFSFPSSSTNQNRPSSSSLNLYQTRSIADGVSRSLDATSIEKLIENCHIIKLFRAESLEAGYILNILYNLDKLTDMKAEQSADDCREIETVFMKSFWEEISKFQSEVRDDDEAILLPEKTGEIVPVKVEDNNFLLQDLTGESDALLSMAFAQYVSDTNVIVDRETTNKTESDEDLIDCYKISKRCVIRNFRII